MATKLNLGIEYFNDPETGKPLASGQVYIGQVDLDPAVEANRVSVTLVQEDGTSVVIAPAAQPLTIGAGGRIMYSGSPVAVTVDGGYSIKVLDNLGSQIYYVPSNNVADPSSEDTGVLVLNGSFEDQNVTAGLPDNWALNIGENGDIAIDSADSAHGLNSLKFTGTDATGGGTATSNLFDVLKGGRLYVNFTYKSSSATTLNKVQVKYYNNLSGVVSTDTVYSEGAANPTSYTTLSVGSDIPATAVRAQVILTGVDGSGTTTTGTTNFDDVFINPGVINTTDNNQRIDASGTTNSQSTYLGSTSIQNNVALRLETDNAGARLQAFGTLNALSGKISLINTANNGIILATGNGTARCEVNHSGGITIEDDAPATPEANTLYADSMVKAWADVENSAGTPAINDGVNLSVTDIGVGNLRFTFATAMANTNYAFAFGTATTTQISTLGKLTTRFEITTRDSGGSPLDIDVNVAVIGAQ